jgi:hypothetical protein
LLGVLESLGISADLVTQQISIGDDKTDYWEIDTGAEDEGEGWKKQKGE